MSYSFLTLFCVQVMGYLSSSSPHIMSGAVSALSLLMYNNPLFCLTVPNLVTSVLALLENKDNEVIKVSFCILELLPSYYAYMLLSNLTSLFTWYRQHWDSSKFWYHLYNPMTYWKSFLILSLRYCHGHQFQSITSDQRYLLSPK